ncbi:MAG: SPW repeat protein [Anaerolineae bacterium]|nr:SPW repeat protein [Anaerolineae bacterium]
MKTTKSLNGLVALVGLWEVLAPPILGYMATPAAVGNAIIAGVTLILLAGLDDLIENASTDKNLDWIIGAAGVWLVVSPFVLGYSTVSAALWNDLIVGAVVIVLAAWGAAGLGQQSTSHA